MEEARVGHFAVKWDVLDDDDRASLDGVSILQGEGRYYALYSSDVDTDATDLWIESMEVIGESRLARAASVLASQDLCAAGGIALVDGGIEEILLVNPAELEQTVIEDSRVPWDRGPNRLYVWRTAEAKSGD